MSNFINYIENDSDSDTDSDYDPEDYDSCYSDTETDMDEREDSEDEDEFEAWLEQSREELIQEILELIRDSGYHYRLSQ